jgi:hypothetical protein
MLRHYHVNVEILKCQISNVQCNLSDFSWWCDGVIRLVIFLLAACQGSLITVVACILCGDSLCMLLSFFVVAMLVLWMFSV